MTSRYLNLLADAWGENPEPPSLEVTRPEDPAPVRRCFFCAAGLPEQPVYTGWLGGAFLCSRCGGWNYPETPRWIEEVTFRALAANRRRQVPLGLSKQFSSAVLAGDEVGARQALAEIEAHTESGEEP